MVVRKPNRICPDCKINIAADYSSYCKACASKRVGAYAKKTGYAWQKKRREEIRELVRKAKDVPCTDCGIRYPHYVMDLDHLGDKEFNVADASKTGMALERVQAEIDKCEPVCANCHRERTHAGLA